MPSRSKAPELAIGNCPYSYYITDGRVVGEQQSMTKSGLRLVSPATEKRTVMPSRRPNAELRPREHLTEREIDKLIAAAKGNRWGQRDATMILVAFRHGLRASEVCGLQWSDVAFRDRQSASTQGQGRGNWRFTRCWAQTLDLRRRGADSLAPSDQGRNPAGSVHPPRRRNRDDHADGRMADADGLCRSGDLAN